MEMRTLLTIVALALIGCEEVPTKEDPGADKLAAFQGCVAAATTMESAQGCARGFTEVAPSPAPTDNYSL
jgi:hypothetical protein